MDSKILDKIRKLIEHERSARSIGSIHEAALFAAKIQELLDQYNLQMSDVDYQEARSNVNSEQIHFPRELNYWRRSFLAFVAHLQGCTICLGNKYFLIIGNEIDRLLVAELFLYFEGLGSHLADAAAREWQSTLEYRRKKKKASHTRDYKNSFLLGYSSQVAERMAAEREKARENSETGLIYIGNKLADAKEWVRSNIATKKVANKAPKSNRFKTEAFLKGVRAGNSVALTTKTID